MTNSDPSSAIQNSVVEDLARSTLGSSGNAIYQMCSRILRERCPSSDVLVDVGAGIGVLRREVAPYCKRYVAVDVVRYDDFPVDAELLVADLNLDPWPLPAGFADAVVSLETIEHVENPRFFFRQLVRLVKRGGFLMVTTPNQLSIVSKLCLTLKNEFSNFRERPGLYPAHITALIEADLRRIAAECGLTDARIGFSNSGRVPGIAKRWPSFCRGRAFSDNICVSGFAPS